MTDTPGGPHRIDLHAHYQVDVEAGSTARFS